jgi:NAD(P)H-hydrate epimerase
MSGSVSMSGLAALRSGAGLVTVATADRALESVAQFHPALMTWPLADDECGAIEPSAVAALPALTADADVVACGPGLSTGRGPHAVVEWFCRSWTKPLVLDADGLNTLATIPDWESLLRSLRCVLTPHPGEFARLSGVNASDRPAQRAAAAAYARRFPNSVIVLKGGPTSVFCGDEEWVNPTGNPAMATAGAGDVLTGMIAGLIAQGLRLPDAVRCGVYAHGLAGDLAAREIGPRGVIATDLIERIPRALTALQDRSIDNLFSPQRFPVHE